MTRITKFKWTGAAACLALLVCGCSSTPAPPNYNKGKLSTALPFSSENYAVAPTDTLLIEVYREPDLSSKYYVDPSGTINMPLIGRVPVSGLNISAIEASISSRLARGYIVDPDVRVSVFQFRPIFVTGEVKKPGDYAFTPGMTVQQAMVMAGGTTRFAAKKFYIQRVNSDTAQQIRVDANSILYPGDIVIVDERLF